MVKIIVNLVISLRHIAVKAISSEKNLQEPQISENKLTLAAMSIEKLLIDLHKNPSLIKNGTS